MKESFWSRFWRTGSLGQDEKPRIPAAPVAPEGEGTVRMGLIFHGRVQGVGFRFMAVNLARPRGLTGWVRNEYDGTVAMEVQGRGADINSLVEELHNQRFIRIERVESQRLTVDTHETGFREKM
jgi:acylphosphatase